MANCVVKDWQGKDAGKASLDLKVAKESSANDLMPCCSASRAHSRQGTASTLTRAEVRGGGRKPYKQKELAVPVGVRSVPLCAPVVASSSDRSPAPDCDEPQGASPGPAHRLMARGEDLVVVKDFGSSETPKTARSPTHSAVWVLRQMPRC